MALRRILPEVHVELEAVTVVVMQRLVHQRLELGRERSHISFGLQVLHGFDVGKGSLATGLGQERHVVPASLVATGAAEVEHPDAGVETALGFRQVAAGRLDGRARNLERPLLLLISHDESVHRFRRS